MDNASKERHLTIKEQTIPQIFQREPKWFHGTVTKQTGSVYYKDQLWKGHVNQIHQTDNSNVQIVAPIQNLQ